MAKKRKADKTFSQSASTKIAKYDVEETFNDSQDEFYAGRDKILLDKTTDSKRRRRLIEQEKDLQPSDEEILGYEDPDDIEISDDNGESYQNEEDIYQDLKALPKSKKRSMNEDSEDEDEDASDEEGWGTNRADYFNADAIETEADALEEETEVKRLHQKQLKNMTEADFGFDEEFLTEVGKDAPEGRSTIEKLPEAKIAEGATAQQRLDILTTRYPELQPLAEDFQRLQAVKEEFDRLTALEKATQSYTKFTSGVPVSVKRNALSAYLGAVAMYFAILASKPATDPLDRTITAMPPVDLHEHPIIHSLARAKELWQRIEHLETATLIPAAKPPQNQQSQSLDRDFSQPKNTPSTRISNALPTKPPSRKANGLPAKTKQTSNKKTQNGTLSTTKPTATDESNRRKKKKPSDKIDAAHLQALVSYTKRTVPLTATGSDNAHDEQNSDIGEETPLTASEAAEKQRKRRSLRFYTSQLASKANRRGHAAREAGGDDDLPYKERQRDRIQRLNSEAEARGARQTSVDRLEDDNDNEDDGAELPRTGGGDVNDEYYDALFSAQERKKAQKKARADAYAEAARLGAGAAVYEEESLGADGKRAITYAIAKNKGLAPKRKKEVRNPRVKKRKKFDEKMKKLGSIRQVYKGGEGKGGYSGELTGIKTNVVKSIKL